MVVAILALGASAFAPAEVDLAELTKIAPSLASMVSRAALEPESLATELRASPVAHVAPTFSSVTPPGAKNASLPIVVAHGMGDSCYNPGMKSITKAAGDRLGVYATCIPTASGWALDTIAGFLKNMDASVDYFAKKVPTAAYPGHTRLRRRCSTAAALKVLCRRAARRRRCRRTRASPTASTPSASRRATT